MVNTHMQATISANIHKQLLRLTFIAVAVQWLMLVQSGFGQRVQETITVVKGSHVSGAVMIEARLDGKAVDLSCLERHADCVIPQPGDYLLVRLHGDQGSYNDCQNVDLFPMDAKQTEKIGEYCLLQP